MMVSGPFEETDAPAPGSGAADPVGHRATPAQWWNGLGRAQRVIGAVVAVAIAVNLGLAGARSLVGGDPGGPVSSSFSTGGDGLEAYADLLRADGHRVVRLREQATARDLPASATAVVVDPRNVTSADVTRLARFVAGGGRLVLAGEPAAELVAALTGVPVRWEPGNPVERLTVWLPVKETGSARVLAGDDGGRWGDVGSLVPVAGSGSGPAVLVGSVGAGRVIALADASPLHNANLGQSDNAAFALAAAGDSARTVVFVESVHGFAASGLDAVPAAWKWAGAGLLVALIAGLWSAGARLGPPEPQRRPLPPPRQAHVDAVAAGLDRVTRSPAETVAPLIADSRSALAAHLGVAADASPGVLHAAAERGGVDPRDVALLVEPVLDLQRALAVGTLAAARQRAVHGLTEPPLTTASAVPASASPRSATPHPKSPGAIS